jgi:mRNA interferase RelE/StbE
LAWKVSFEPRALTELEKLDRQAQKRIVRYFQGRIAGREDPRRFGKALQGDKGDLWRYRIGDYRAVCEIQDDGSIVFVLRVAHRKDIYR